MALIIDSSGSMLSNDPSRRRVVAGKSYLTAAGASDVVGVVDFDSGVQIRSEAVNPKTNDAQLKAALDAVDSSGGTDIGAGVQGGCDVLSRSGSQPVKAAILLTDGQGGYNDQNACFRSNGWKLYTFGLGSSVDDSLLTRIAEETGGRYKNLATVDNLICEFNQVRAAAAGRSDSACGLAELIKLGQTIIKTVPILPRLLQAVFSISWPGSDVGLTLISPSGRRITVNTDAFDVSADQGSTFKTISVYKPEPGNWTIELVGLDIEPQGEPVTFSTAQVPLANQLPSAVIGETELIDRATGTFRFSATGSSDSDGHIVDYLWDFGDGLAGSGSTVEHRFPAPGTYTVRLTVVDDDVETATVEQQVEVPAGMVPVPFAIAAKTATSRLIAEGTPTAGGVDGTVYGYLEDERKADLPVSTAGLTSGPGGEDVIAVSFTVGHEEWTLRFTRTTPTTGTVELCGPGGCVPGLGADLLSMSPEQRAATEQSFGVGPPPTSTTTAVAASAPATTTTSPTTTTIAGTLATPSTTASSSTADHCGQLRHQYNQTSDPFARLRILSTARAYRCSM